MVGKGVTGNCVVGKGVTGWGVGRGVEISPGHGGQFEFEDKVGDTLRSGLTFTTGAGVSKQMVGV